MVIYVLLTVMLIYATADMRICFTDVFFLFFAFSVRHKNLPDNRSWEWRLNGFS